MITRGTPWLTALQWSLIVGMFPAINYGVYWLVSVFGMSTLAIAAVDRELSKRDRANVELESMRCTAKSYEKRMLLAETRVGVLEARNIQLERELDALQP